MDLSWLKRFKYRFEKRAVALMYHSIDEPATDPWELSVSPENFEEHLQVLKKYRLVSPCTLAKELGSKNIRSGTVCLTFDDAYEDNFSKAKPLLEKYAAPAMFFVSTHFIGRDDLFWWDELSDLLLGSQPLPQQLSITISNTVYQFNLGADAVLDLTRVNAQLRWCWHQAPPTLRCSLYLDIWKLLRPLPHDDIQEALDFLHQWSGLNKARKGNVMNSEQLSQLKEHPYIETGIHTVTHPALASHGKEAQMRELKECRDVLLAQGHKAEIVAYPYGSYNKATVEVVAELALSAAFTTAEKAITSKAPKYEMGRFQVRNVNGEQFEKDLKRWFTLSPSS